MYLVKNATASRIDPTESSIKDMNAYVRYLLTEIGNIRMSNETQQWRSILGVAEMMQ